MASLNKVFLMGNLTRDPELRYLPSGTAVCEFGLATNRKYKDGQGNLQEDTCFVDISVFGKQAETANQYLSKGRPLFIEGRLKYDQWQAKDGSKRSKLRIIAENFQFLGAGQKKAPLTDEELEALAARVAALSNKKKEEEPVTNGSELEEVDWDGDVPATTTPVEEEEIA